MLFETHAKTPISKNFVSLNGFNFHNLGRRAKKALKQTILVNFHAIVVVLYSFPGSVAQCCSLKPFLS